MFVIAVVVVPQGFVHREGDLSDKKVRLSTFLGKNERIAQCVWQSLVA